MEHLRNFDFSKIPVSGFGVLALIAAFPLTIIVYYFFLFFYRLFLHPLSHIPGPWLPAMSYLPEFYWNCVKDGQLPDQLAKWHDKYGKRSHFFHMGLDTGAVYGYENGYLQSNKRM